MQEVTVAVGPGTITVVCRFAEGSEGRGCHIVITEQNSGASAGSLSLILTIRVPTVAGRLPRIGWTTIAVP